MVMLTAALWSKSYADEQETITAWNGGKDFKIGLGGPYCSIRDVGLLKKQFGSVFILHGKDKTVLVA